MKYKIALLANRELGEKCRRLLSQSAELVDPRKADVGFSVLWHQKIKEPELSQPKRGWINLHIGALPDYGGIYTAYHAILNAEKEFGVTLHEINEGLDTGPIIDVCKFNLTGEETPNDIYDKAFEVAYYFFEEWLPRLLDWDYETRPNEGGRYYNADDYRRIRHLFGE